mmetsp:Transcript_56169/g.133346  ORF Transcript_56169/g.133346 Transcript_56169/m.133346 type:complete len:214 (+) Transcript_56169:1022-1663(+)
MSARTSSSSERRCTSSVSDTPLRRQSVRNASTARTRCFPCVVSRRSNRSLIRPRTEGLISNFTPSYDVHSARNCATIVSHSGVPAASSFSPLSRKAASTAASCSGVKVRPWSLSRCLSTRMWSEMVSTSTMQLPSDAPSASPRPFLSCDRHWNSALAGSGSVETTMRTCGDSPDIGSHSSRRPALLSSSWSTESMKSVSGCSSDGHSATALRK